MKFDIPFLDMNDGMVNAIAKEYYEDINFSRSENGSINMWKLYNGFNRCYKIKLHEYNFLERTVNAYSLTQGLVKAMNGESSYSWFLG